jgi:hypothetical protein
MSNEVDVAVHKIAAKRKRDGFAWLLVSVVLALLVAGMGAALRDAHDAKGDVAAIKSGAQTDHIQIKNLKKSLSAQRAQFQACKGKKAGSPGCTIPISPPAGKIGPQGVQGMQGIAGPPGPIGPQGPQGLQGVPGADGKNGAHGIQGDPGPAGDPGPPGTPGDTGPQGPEGPTGAKGDTGPAGPKGDTGPTGPKGDTGPEPKSFTFSQGPFVYTCTDPDGDGNYTCDSGTP